MGKQKQRKHKCRFEGCKELHTDWYEYKPENGVWSCAEHAEYFGFCFMCGNFWAGVESFDFSRVKGVCENCISEFDDDFEDDQDEWSWMDEYPTGYDMIEGETYGVHIGKDNPTMGGSQS